MGKVYTTTSLEETKSLAKELITRLLLVKGRRIIALYGNLGAGKTTFVQGLAEGLEIDKRIISPTFILVREYKLKSQNANRKTTAQNSKFFYHIDLYRIQDQNDIKGLGIEEIINDRNNIVAIEWAEKLGDLLPKKRWDITFEYISENKRKIIIKNEKE